MLSRQQQPHPRGDDRERITRARQAAEALFTSKPPITPVRQAAPPDQSARKPRVLEIIRPPMPARHDQPQRPVVPPVEIPRTQFARIRTLAKYGMTVGQVAEVYRVPVGEIERLLRKA